jgi:phosphatidylinositol-3-phosphatase
MPLAVVLAVTFAVVAGSVRSAPAQASLPLCGSTGAPATGVHHVIVVMMENLSYNQVVGSKNAPYQTSLASQCGASPSYFAATHTSAANYLGVSAGEFPATSLPGCASVKICTDTSNNLYNQLTTAGLGWAGFVESMPSNCDPTSEGRVANGHKLYSIGHNPEIFYSDISKTSCQANDVGVNDLTAQSGAFWDALQNQTLPAFSFVTPNTADDDEGGATKALGEQAGDAFLQRFVSLVQGSNSYQSGDTLLLITYDEGAGPDFAKGEDCTDPSLDLPIVNGVSTHQESCHIPLFVVYPYTPGGSADTTFFDHYSITKTVEDIFGLPYLAHAGDPQTASLLGHFGIPGGTPPPPPPLVTISQPTAGSTASGQLNVSGTAASSAGIAQVQVSIDGGPPQIAIGTASWAAVLDTTSVANGVHVVTVKATDQAGVIGTATVTVTVANTTSNPGCPATLPGSTELSGNVSLETNQTGWTGIYNSNSAVSRVAPAGGSYDGSWALRIAPKASGAAGVNNAAPVWVPGPPGTTTTVGQVFTGSALVQASFPGQKIALVVRETTPSGTKLAGHTTTITAGDTAWHNLSSSYTATATGDEIRTAVFSSNFANTSQYLLADCLSLQAH